MKIWASSPSSADTLAFAQAVTALAIAIEWVDRAEAARVWIVDGAAPAPASRAQYESLQPAPAVAYLGQLMRDLPHPGWAFFKVPVKPQLVAHWLHLHRLVDGVPPVAVPAPPAAGRELWRLSPVQLARWPNLARYGRDLYLIAACSQLLKEPTTYAALLATGAAPASLDALLADAWADGILRVAAQEAVRPPAAVPSAPMPLASPPASRPADLSPAAPGEADRWGLFKRLLSRFTRR